MSLLGKRNMVKGKGTRKGVSNESTRVSTVTKRQYT